MDSAEADSGIALANVELDADSGMLAKGAGVDVCELLAEAVCGLSGLGSGAGRLAGVGEGVTCVEVWPACGPIEEDE